MNLDSIFSHIGQQCNNKILCVLNLRANGRFKKEMQDNTVSTLNVEVLPSKGKQNDKIFKSHTGRRKNVLIFFNSAGHVNEVDVFRQRN